MVPRDVVVPVVTWRATSATPIHPEAAESLLVEIYLEL